MVGALAEMVHNPAMKDLRVMLKILDTVALRVMADTLKQSPRVGSEISRQRLFDATEEFVRTQAQNTWTDQEYERSKTLFPLYFEITERISKVHPSIMESPAAAVGALYSDDMIDGFYRENRVFTSMNQEAAKTFKSLVSSPDFGRECPIRVLEVGAGVGGLTKFLVEAFLAQSFTYKNIVAKMYDLAKTPAEQGLQTLISWRATLYFKVTPIRLIELLEHQLGNLTYDGPRRAGPQSLWNARVITVWVLLETAKAPEISLRPEYSRRSTDQLQVDTTSGTPSSLSPTMGFRSLASLYTLIYALNIVQIALGAWIMHNFDWKETAEAQFTLMFVALYALPMIYLLTRYQRRTEHRLSRVHENTNFLAFMVIFWSVAEVFAIAFVVMRASTAGASCPPRRLLSLRCLPLVLSLLLPLAHCVIFVHVAKLIRERARAMYGEEMVPLPLPSTPAPDPVERFIRGRVRPMFGEQTVPLPLPTTPPLPVKLVPAWTLGRIPELEFEAGDSKPAGPLSI
ncbi:hypothetical protein DFH08DRAFT_1078412 [Mycena albidolilacea]|uniref:Uncharacterized protein n=1 Tax=Mycena albidolilacea TaxID=1033008 RepID=A0AAD7ETR7_9AGAR|nr:hypothetical protein DFH08DRAFT_1078412 [Mycena albidolilacea]